MSDDDFSPDGARAAAERDDLAGWVSRFLASPGSDNAELAAQLRQRYLWWYGPTAVPLDELHRLAGPPGAPVQQAVDEDDWRDDVDDLARRIRAGHEPPPSIATHRGDHLVLEDGNHRVEALRRAGREVALTIVGFDEREARDRYARRRDRR